MVDRWPITRYAITGGTGTLGRAIIRRLLADESAERIVSVSRSESRIAAVQEEFGDDPRLRFLMGDVRDEPRLGKAFYGCQVVIHAAALKRVQQGVSSPDEMIKTNIFGTQAVVEAARPAGIKKVIVVSSDKAVEPVNLYGATKLVAEQWACQANAYTWPRGLAVGCVRYGNVLGSTGSVLGIWRARIAAGEPIMLTDARMTRFVITPDQAAEFVLDAIYDVQGGEVFVPVLPSARMVDLALAVASEDYPTVVGGLRQGGEKLHERLLTSEERLHRLHIQMDGRRFAVVPSFRSWSDEPYDGKTLVMEHEYESGLPETLLSIDDIRALLKDVEL